MAELCGRDQILIYYKHDSTRKNGTPGVTAFNTHSEIHKMAERAMPAKMSQYRHAILLFKLFRNIICENEYIHMNFQLYDNERQTKLKFIKNQNYDVGKNILLNRFCDLNDLIDKKWMNLSLETYKIKCKALFLETNND